MTHSDPTAFRPTNAPCDPHVRERHQRWRAMLKSVDWTRIRALSRQVNDAFAPAPLTDLSVPLRVSVCTVGQQRRFQGECIGTLRDGRVAVLVSELTDRE